MNNNITNSFESSNYIDYLNDTIMNVCNNSNIYNNTINRDECIFYIYIQILISIIIIFISWLIIPFMYIRDKIIHKFKNICPICFNNEINMAIVPCGHVYCNNCINNYINKTNNNNLCAICRYPYQKYIKIYL